MKLMIDPEWETAYWELTPAEMKVFEDDRNLSLANHLLMYPSLPHERSAEVLRLEGEALKIYKSTDRAVLGWRDASRWAGASMFGIPVRVSE